MFRRCDQLTNAERAMIRRRAVEVAAVATATAELTAADD